ncbi:MAG: MFS transporter [Planctomycetota bacterium]
MTDDIIRQTRTGRLVIRSTHRRRSIRAAIFTAMLHTIGATCLLASALQLYCLSLGADDLYLGLLNFAIWAGAPFLLLGITLMRRFGKRRILVFWAGIMPAACMAFAVLLPVMGRFGWISPAWILYWLLAATLMRSITDNIGGAGWFPMLQDNVPSRITGKFFGTFRMYWQSSVLVTALLIAWFLGSEPAWWKFCVVFAVGETSFIAKIFFLKQLKEKPQPKNAHDLPSSWGVLRRAIADRNTRHFLGYILLYNIAAFMCLPFQIKYLKDLGYSAGYIVAATSMVSVGAIVSLRFWGKLADRFGNRSIFSISHIGITVVLATWLLVDKNAFSAVFVFVLYAGWSIFQSANGIAYTRHMFHAVPETDQSNLVIVNAFSFLSVAIAPLISGLFLKLSADWHFESGGLSVNNYHMLFLFAALLVLAPGRICKTFQNNVETSAVGVFVIITRPLRTLFGPFVSFPTKRNNSK